MPNVPKHFCRAAYCTALVEGGYCPAHAAAKEQGRTNVDLRRLYRTVRWSELRRIVLQEEPLCPECAAEGFIGATEDVHHTQKATRENFFNRAILHALCHKHHSRHTQRGE